MDIDHLNKFSIPFNRGFYLKLEENWPMGFRGLSKVWMDDRRKMMDGK